MEAATARLKSLKSISKITSTMKAISASKLARAEKEVNRIRLYGQAAVAFYDRIEISLPQTIEPKTLYVAVTSDKGLCGLCNAQVCQFIKQELEKEESRNNAIMCIGTIGTNILKHYQPNLIVLSADKYEKTLPSFLETSEIAQELKKLQDNFNHVKIVYNDYLGLTSFRTLQLSIYNTEVVHMTQKLITTFGNVHLEDIESYLDFSLAMILFYVIRTSYTTEQGARLQAMHNATRNIDKLHKKLSLIAQRSRQAAITNELLEVVSAAAVLQKKD